MKRSWFFVVLGWLGAVALGGCGGGGDERGNVGDGSGGGSSSATGGDSAVNPGSVANCEDYCTHSIQCFASLCEEDSGTPVPTGFVDLLSATCTSTCTAQLLQAGIEQNWDCLFENSCREVFADDVCHAEASYSCI